MRWFGLSASISVMLSAGCTAPNPAFELEVRADSGDASKGSSVSDGSTDADSTGSDGDGHDSKADDGHDDDGHDDDGHDDDGSESGDDGDPQGCRVTDCDDDEYCAFPEGAFCAIESEIRGTCTPRPDVCQGIGAPVFGCDCGVYDNACEAQRAGVDVLCRVDEDFCLC